MVICSYALRCQRITRLGAVCDSIHVYDTRHAQVIRRLRACLLTRDLGTVRLHSLKVGVPAVPHGQRPQHYVGETHDNRQALPLPERFASSIPARCARYPPWAISERSAVTESERSMINVSRSVRFWMVICVSPLPKVRDAQPVPSVSH